MIEQHWHATGKALLLPGIGNGDRLLMFPCPPASRSVHWEGIELTAFLVLLPILGQHAILALVVEGQIQQFPSRHIQHRRSKLFECFGQALSSSYNVGDLKKQSVPVVFKRGISPEFETYF